MRAVMSRLAATLLVALLASPAVGPCLPDAARETGAASAQDPGMAAPPGPVASAAVAIAPVVPAAPLSASARVVLTFATDTSPRVGDRVLRPVAAVRRAPAILRL